MTDKFKVSLLKELALPTVQRSWAVVSWCLRQPGNCKANPHRLMVAKKSTGAGLAWLINMHSLV